jgi:hypothetical protein
MLITAENEVAPELCSRRRLALWFGPTVREEVVFESHTTTQRIEVAKTKMGKVLDHFLYVVELHANNSFVVYSQTLVSQIPPSYAANAFNVFQRSMHQIEIVRLCAIWDSADADKENIPMRIGGRSRPRRSIADHRRPDAPTDTV